MLDLIEDEMLRMAAEISAIMYGMDANEDGKVSAYEAELVPEDGVPYGSTPEGGRWLPPKVSRTSRTCGIWMSIPPTT